MFEVLPFFSSCFVVECGICLKMGYTLSYGGMHGLSEPTAFRFSSAICDSRAQLWDTKHDRAKRSARKLKLGSLAHLVAAKLDRPATAVGQREREEVWRLGDEYLAPFRGLPAGPTLAQREKTFSPHSKQVRDVLLTSWQEAFQKPSEPAQRKAPAVRRVLGVSGMIPPLLLRSGTQLSLQSSIANAFKS